MLLSDILHSRTLLLLFVLHWCPEAPGENGDSLDEALYIHIVRDNLCPKAYIEKTEKYETQRLVQAQTTGQWQGIDSVLLTSRPVP